MARIQLTDNALSAIVKMADGNPGATVAMSELLKHGDAVDPDAFMGGLGNILSLDTLGIYGPRIWILYSDVCGKNVTCMIGLLRAVQLGLMGESELNRAIDVRGSMDAAKRDSYVTKVREHLPRFGVSATAA